MPGSGWNLAPSPSKRWVGTGGVDGGIFDLESATLPETNIAHENPVFPGKYHQNGGFPMAMLVYRSVMGNPYISPIGSWVFMGYNPQECRFITQ